MTLRNGHSRNGKPRKPIKRGRAKESINQSDVLDAISELTSLFMRRSGDLQIFGAGGTTAPFRWKGRNYPFYQNEQELAQLRAMSRILCGSGTYGAGLIEGFASYVLSTGMTYEMTPRKGADEALAQVVCGAAQSVVDLHLKRNQWFGGEQPGLETEFFRRSRRDGEAILVHFPQEDGTTDERFAEPDMLTQPPGTMFETHGFGIITDKDDTSKPLAYCLNFRIASEPQHSEEFEPDFVTHLRCNVDRNIKRGMPDFAFDAYEGLEAASKLRNAMGVTAANQASISSVTEYENATGDQVSALIGTESDYQINDALTGLMEYVKRVKAGTNLHVPKGQKYVEGPMATNAEKHLAILDMLIRSASRPWNAPDWLASGDASGSTFANALHEESPWLRRILREQGVYTEALKTALRFALRHWCETRGLKANGRVFSWEEVKSLVELTVTAPPPTVRDKLQDAQCDEVYTRIGAKSVQEVAREQGYDPDKVQEERDAWRDSNPDGMAGMGLPGMYDPTPPTQGGSGATSQPAKESVQLVVANQDHQREFDRLREDVRNIVATIPKSEPGQPVNINLPEVLLKAPDALLERMAEVQEKSATEQAAALTEMRAVVTAFREVAQALADRKPDTVIVQASDLPVPVIQQAPAPVVNVAAPIVNVPAPKVVLESMNEKVMERLTAALEQLCKPRRASLEFDAKGNVTGAKTEQG